MLTIPGLRGRQSQYSIATPTQFHPGSTHLRRGDVGGGCPGPDRRPDWGHGALRKHLIYPFTPTSFKLGLGTRKSFVAAPPRTPRLHSHSHTFCLAANGLDPADRSLTGDVSQQCRDARSVTQINQLAASNGRIHFTVVIVMGVHPIPSLVPWLWSRHSLCFLPPLPQLQPDDSSVHTPPDFLPDGSAALHTAFLGGFSSLPPLLFLLSYVE